jgi:hypothetical protein
MKATTRITSFILGAAIMASASASSADVIVLDPGQALNFNPLVCEAIHVDDDCDLSDCPAQLDCAFNSVRAFSSFTGGLLPGSSSAKGYLYARFDISGTDPVNVPATIKSEIATKAAILAGLGAGTTAGYEVKLIIRDVGEGNSEVASKIIVAGTCNEFFTVFCGEYDEIPSTATLSASLIRGHSYTVGFEVFTEVDWALGVAYSAEVSVRTLDADGIRVAIGKDPFQLIAELDERTTTLEGRTTILEERTTSLEERTTTLEAETAATQSALEALEAAFNAEMAATRLALAELQTTFNSHQHTYRTGEGIGHNKVMSATTPPDGAVSSASSDVGALGRLSAVDVNGSESGYAPVTQGQTTGVGSEPAVVFALEGVRPNPASGRDLRVAFALPSGAAAQLELLDVRGRQVMSSAVGSLGAGRHMVSLAEGGRVAPGVYWVRLTQGANQRTTQVVVIE